MSDKYTINVGPAFFVAWVLLAFLYCGDPDLHDAIISRMECREVSE